jgi:dihydrofolate reductase
MTLSLFAHVTLDGVAQGPARQDEDPRDGFSHGGWATPFADSVLGGFIGEALSKKTSLLLGRRTYEDFFKVWPNRIGNPFTAVLEASTKYVASRRQETELPWANSVLLAGDARERVASLKKTGEGDLLMLGSVSLAHVLTANGLIDRYVLATYPLLLGTGKRLFPNTGASRQLTVKQSLATSTGVVLTVYEAVS